MDTSMVGEKPVWFEGVGGTVLVKALDVPAMEAAMRAADLAGARLFLLRAGARDEDDGAPPRPGTLCWIELRTTDPGPAPSFHGRVLGYTRADLGTPHVLEAGGGPGGGVLAVPRARATWLTCVADEDLDATIATSTPRASR